MGFTHMNDTERAEIIRLGRQAMLTQSAIAHAVGRSQKTVSEVLRKAKADGFIDSLPHEKRADTAKKLAAETCALKQDDDRIISEAGLSPTLEKGYIRLRDGARYRGIPFTLTPKEWGLLWEQSPVDGPGTYLSRRKDITLGYSFDNMEVVSRREFYTTKPKGWGAKKAAKTSVSNGSSPAPKANGSNGAAHLNGSAPSSNGVDRSPIDIIEKTYFFARYETEEGQRVEGPFTSAEEAMQVMMERRIG